MNIPDRKYVYVLMTWSAAGLRLPTWVGKVGFSHDADIRAADIERSIWQVTGYPVRVRVFFRVRVFLYRQIETAIHTVIRPYQSRRFAGCSGGTEFFHTLNPFAAVLFGLLMYGWGSGCPQWWAACVLLLPWPIDFAVFVLLLAAVEYLLALLALYLLTIIIPALVGLI